MASDDSRETFESWLNKATDPHNQEDRWDCIEGFYKLVIQENDGPQVALRLLAHKVQSPQEKEALQALTVLEACMNNCGKRFHSEAAKFRFLNELIKVLTPKYLGTCTPKKVKDRVTEVLYGWTLWLKEEPKIQEAYNMLKKQGIVKMDPKLPDTLIMAPPPQRTTESVFDQEDKAKLLARLLKSGRPEDLETANRLIKSTMKEEQERAEKVAKRESTLAEVESSSKQLREILEQEIVTGTSVQPSDDVKELYERCDRLRPSLFRLASDTTDDDAALAQILAANDELTLAVNAYKDVMARGTCNLGRLRSKSEEVTSKSISSTNRREIKSYHLIDLSALDSPQIQRKTDSSPHFESSSPVFHSHLEDSFFPAPKQDIEFDDLDTKQIQQNPKSYYEELMQIDKGFQMTNGNQNGGREILLRARGGDGNNDSSDGTNTWSNSLTKQLPGLESHKQPNKDFGSPLILQESRHPAPSLKDIFVPLETIRFSQLEPITLYNTAGIHVSLHFAKDCPSGHPGVAVAVMSAVNTSALDVKDFVFQVAVPMSMLVKLQPASQTRLPPYNPLLPPPAVSQVLLLANPESRKVKLRYKLTLTHGDRRLVEAGEIESFPDWTILTGQK
ncbi:ADP-ribosylation factor-binding protein GGA3-like [Gambusia affinis]|uniref:ADP-ribosylation factor-binding protein GGA3-like n=1 Tax=Gambusia affinis TaxID=33528 RepID=UPI001CDC3670|nr:ADP-ribosylation factor-binding protein GGA3-like [Gambusia affinis]